MRHLTIVRVPVPADDKLHEALCVPQHGRRPGLGHTHQALPVHLEDLVIDSNPTVPGIRGQYSSQKTQMIILNVIEKVEKTIQTTPVPFRFQN